MKKCLPHFPFKLHKITPVLCEEINTKTAEASFVLKS